VWLNVSPSTSSPYPPRPLSFSLSVERRLFFNRGSFENLHLRPLLPLSHVFPLVFYDGNRAVLFSNACKVFHAGVSLARNAPAYSAWIDRDETSRFFLFFLVLPSLRETVSRRTRSLPARARSCDNYPLVSRFCCTPCLVLPDYCTPYLRSGRPPRFFFLTTFRESHPSPPRSCSSPPTV